ncbi:MAG: nuclear transport factor 2 family protein [Rhodanobacter sp.]
MKNIWLATLALTGMIGLAHADGVPAQPDHTAATAQVQQLVDAFQAAIIAGDGNKLNTMFLPSNGAWISVYDDATYRLVKAKHPGAPKLMPGNFKEFTDFVSSKPKPMEEKFSNVRIQTNGTVATVYFDYIFLLDGKQTNNGNETWQLVNTNDGWKINSMLYSITMAPAMLH